MSDRQAAMPGAAASRSTLRQIDASTYVLILPRASTVVIDLSPLEDRAFEAREVLVRLGSMLEGAGGSLAIAIPRPEERGCFHFCHIDDFGEDAPTASNHPARTLPHENTQKESEDAAHHRTRTRPHDPRRPGDRRVRRRGLRVDAGQPAVERVTPDDQRPGTGGGDGERFQWSLERDNADVVRLPVAPVRRLGSRLR